MQLDLADGVLQAWHAQDSVAPSQNSTMYRCAVPEQHFLSRTKEGMAIKTRTGLVPPSGQSLPRIKPSKKRCGGQVCADDIEAVCGYERDSLDTVEGFDARVIQCLQVRAHADLQSLQHLEYQAPSMCPQHLLFIAPVNQGATV